MHPHTKIPSLLSCFTIALITILICKPIHVSAAEQVRVSMDEKYLQEQIKKAIKENPGMVYQVLNKYQQTLQKEQPVQDNFEVMFKQRIKDEAKEYNVVIGDADAPIEIIAYIDYQCPNSAAALNTLMRMYKNDGHKFKLIIKNNPLEEIHDLALPAAQSALAAGKQGKYQQYHRLLLKNREFLNETTLAVIANTLNLDMPRFYQDRYSSDILDNINADKADAKRHHFIGTPIFIINGVVIKGAVSEDFFTKVLDRLSAETGIAKK